MTNSWHANGASVKMTVAMMTKMMTKMICMIAMKISSFHRNSKDIDNSGLLELMASGMPTVYRTIAKLCMVSLDVQSHVQIRFSLRF